MVLVAKKLEEKDLGRRPMRMVEILGLVADVYDEVEVAAIIVLLHLKLRGGGV